jgi:Spy/CpxP family protein refolding chaperone
MRIKTNLLRYALIGTTAFALLPAGQLAAAANNTNPTAKSQNQNRSNFDEQAAQKRFRRVSDLLNLTPQQQTQARQIFQQAWQNARPIVSQLRENRDSLTSLATNSSQANLNPNGNNFNAKLDQYARQEGNLVSKLAEIHGRALHQFYSILTPDQQRKAQDVYALMTSPMPFHFGMTPGHMGMQGRMGMHGRMQGRPSTSE